MKDSHNKLKTQRIYTQVLEEKPEIGEDELTSQRQFDDKDTFVVAKATSEDVGDHIEKTIEQVIRPPRKRRFLLRGLLGAFTALLAWQSVDTFIMRFKRVIGCRLRGLGLLQPLPVRLGSLVQRVVGSEKLRHQFSVQDKIETLITNDSVGQGKAFCESLATEAGITLTSQSYQRWQKSVNASHSDSEIIEMYDAIVVSELDTKATKIVTKYSTESAALVAISPLAIADMLLVAWRSFKMVESLAQVYGVQLGYLSRLKLFKSILINMAFVGVSELAIDASMDLLSMDLAAKVSARAGQGLGVGILTAGWTKSDVLASANTLVFRKTSKAWCYS